MDSFSVLWSQSCSLTCLKIKCKSKVHAVNDKVLEIIKEENNLNMQLKKDDLEREKMDFKDEKVANVKMIETQSGSLKVD